MKEFGIPTKLINLTKMTICGTLNKIKIQTKLSEYFITNRGIRQRDSLSTLLFNIGLEKVMREIIINPGGTIFNRSKKYMAYADDIVIIARNTEAVNEVVSQMQPAAKEAGLITEQKKIHGKQQE
jgi:hypothetical protein